MSNFTYQTQDILNRVFDAQNNRLNVLLAGDQATQQFLNAALSVMGDTRLLWLPAMSETTTSTDRSRHAATLTYDATIASRLSRLGSGVAVSFNGTSGEADTPDADRYSFGDGAVDSPFSIIVLANVTDTASTRAFLSKFTTTSDQREWAFSVRSDDKLQLFLSHLASGANIGRQSSGAITMGSWAFYVATYDGSSASTGIRLYTNGTRVDGANNNAGTYVAMSNGTGSLNLGMTAPAANFFQGSMALAGLCAKALTQNEIWYLKAAINSYFNLSL